MTISQILNRAFKQKWLAPSLVGLVFYALLVGWQGSFDGFRFFNLIHVGQYFSKPSLLLPGQKASPGVGYDGQFYFFIAEDPFLRNPNTATSLDNSLRYRRILYPFLAWLLSLGQRSWVPLSLAIVNVLAASGTVGFCAYAAFRQKRNSWWALTVGVSSGLWLATTADLTEPLQCLLLAAGFVLESSFLLFLAGLAKETALVALMSETTWNGWKHRWRGAALGVLFLALSAIWALWVQGHVAAHESTLGGHFLDPPGAPIIALAQQWSSSPAKFVLTLIAFVLCVGILVRLIWVRDRISWAAGAYAALSLMAGTDTWVDPVASHRVMVAAVVLLFLSWVSSQDRLGRYLLLLSAASGLLILMALSLVH